MDFSFVFTDWIRNCFEQHESQKSRKQQRHVLYIVSVTLTRLFVTFLLKNANVVLHFTHVVRSTVAQVGLEAANVTG